MTVELRKCNKLLWALCDGNCDRCNTYSTSSTINLPSSSIRYYCVNCVRYDYCSARGICIDPSVCCSLYQSKSVDEVVRC